LLYFVGRDDRQVKVRGYRVELDEVEAALTRHPDVSEAAAIVAGDPREVVAHVTAAQGGLPTEDELRRFVSRELSPYAVPGRITIRSIFPRTGTGKIDRKRLEETCNE
jgi:acyl-coenzyme A synthetase/AMP-(fatty) acid ligase